MFCTATAEEEVTYCRLSCNSCCCRGDTEQGLSYLGGDDAISLREELAIWLSPCGDVFVKQSQATVGEAAYVYEEISTT